MRTEAIAPLMEDSRGRVAVLLVGLGRGGSALSLLLAERSFLVSACELTEPALSEVEWDRFDIVLLGADLTYAECLACCADLRERCGAASLIVFGPLSEEWEPRALLRCGADDYLLTSASVDVLVERLHVNHWRSRTQRHARRSRASLRVSSGVLEVLERPSPVFNGVPLEVPPVQARLLLILLEASAPVTAAALARAAWPDSRVAQHTVHTHIALLRARLTELGIRVRYIRGEGYRLE